MQENEVIEEVEAIQNVDALKFAHVALEEMDVY